MQTILGSGGQIADELSKELNIRYTSAIRLVSRKPVKVNETDILFKADLLNADEACAAVEGSEVVYLTVGLPMDTAIWEKQFPIIMSNTIHACKKNNARLVYFDNTYMYPQTPDVQTEETAFKPNGRKGKVRAGITQMLLREMEAKTLNAVICRAPEFYGAGKTQSITRALIFENIRSGKKLKVLLKDNKLRTLIWTPDASKSMALIGNTPDTYGQTWHLPCDDTRLTYKELIELASEIYEKKFSYTIISKPILQLGAIFSKQARELLELLPRYEYDNIFDSSKFKKRFPEFRITTYNEGIRHIMNEQK